MTVNFAANKFDLFTTLDANLSTQAVGCAVHYRLEVEIRDWTPRQVRPLLLYGSEENRWWVNLYLPPGAQIQQLYSNDEPTGGEEGTWGERLVASVFTEAPFFDPATVGVEWSGSGRYQSRGR